LIIKSECLNATTATHLPHLDCIFYKYAN